MNKPTKPPQWQTDLAGVLRLAIGPKDYVFTLPNSNNPLALSDKYKRMLQRTGLAIDYDVFIGVTLGTIRVKGVTKGAPLHTKRTPRELAAILLELYNQHGGRLE